MHFTNKKQSRLKVAELTSGVGALVLGIGLGAYFSEEIIPLAVPIIIVGAISHAWGMFDKNRIEKNADLVIPPWETALYWLCWFLLVGLGIALIFFKKGNS